MIKKKINVPNVFGCLRISGREWRSATDKNKFEINLRRDSITMITVLKVYHGVSFLQRTFFLKLSSPRNIFCIAMCHICVQITLCNIDMQLWVHVYSESYGPWFTETFDRLDIIVKKKLNMLMNGLEIIHRSHCRMPHLLSEATVRCCQTYSWTVGKEEKK